MEHLAFKGQLCSWYGLEALHVYVSFYCIIARQLRGLPVRDWLHLSLILLLVFKVLLYRCATACKA